MVDLLNKIGITHVCFGNHESDVPYAALQEIFLIPTYAILACALHKSGVPRATLQDSFGDSCLPSLCRGHRQAIRCPSADHPGPFFPLRSGV